MSVINFYSNIGGGRGLQVRLLYKVHLWNYILLTSRRRNTSKQIKKTWKYHNPDSLVDDGRVGYKLEHNYRSERAFLFMDTKSGKKRSKKGFVDNLLSKPTS